MMCILLIVKCHRGVVINSFVKPGQCHLLWCKLL